MRRLLLLIVFSVVLAGCAVPHERGDLSLQKTAASKAEVTTVFKRYRAVRNTAIELLDPKPLSTVESGPVLAIDSGSFEVSQRLAQKQKQDTSPVEVTDVLTPNFTRYPLWFFAVVRDEGLGVNRVQIFEREAASDPWLLVASPETLTDTDVPGVRRGGGGQALTVKPDDKVGMSMSPQQAAKTYAAAIGSPSSAAAGKVANDSFIKQMRATATTNAGLKDVAFAQSWGADDVKYVLRTTDGGALAFVTLLRLDNYTVKDGLTITWPKGSPQEAFLSSGISSSGKLRYFHQVLLYIPPGSGKPRALGQYGGVVSADGQ
ncbi:hypothetical protein [Aeromicrobium sp.]|uniref:hypothetical protein n=1 Tax=Aeromicrobium sp. TaxID=1871063 RepID=UPI00199AA081|nr:hypothetical protein [Aeromicrobium sp.]MBC7631573.1 hypothetical protein [Aeromicrobium sp.]